MRKSDWPNVLGAVLDDGSVVISNSGRSLSTYRRDDRERSRNISKVVFGLGSIPVLLRGLVEVVGRKGGSIFDRGNLCCRSFSGVDFVEFELFEVVGDTFFPRLYWRQEAGRLPKEPQQIAGNMAARVKALIEWELGTKGLQAKEDPRMPVGLPSRPPSRFGKGVWNAVSLPALGGPEAWRGDLFRVEPIDSPERPPEEADAMIGIGVYKGQKVAVATTVGPPRAEPPTDITWTHRIRLAPGG